MSKVLSKCLGCGNEYYAGLFGSKKCTKCGDYADPDSHEMKMYRDNKIYRKKIEKEIDEKSKFNQAMYDKGWYENFYFIKMLGQDNLYRVSFYRG